MLKAFAQYLVGLKENKIYEIGDQTYSDHALERIAPYVARPREIEVNGLDSIVNLVINEVSKMPDDAMPIFIRVESPRDVTVFSGLDGDMKRNFLYRAVCDAPDFREGFREYEKAIIELRSKFIQNEGTNYLLDLLSRISKENGVTTSDNGVTQTVEARSGIALKAKETIKPRVELIPYRTFTEVSQPASEFLLRLDDKGNVGFFEADGSAWKLEAKTRISNYFKNAFSAIRFSDNVVILT